MCSDFLRSACLALALVLAPGAVAQSLPPALLEKAQALPAPTGDELRRHAAVLAAMTPAQRAAFEQRVAQWDAQVPAAQRERREAWQAWRALPEAERQQLRAAAAAFSAMPPDQQQTLRTQYDALDGSERRGWLLGPVLGTIYPKLHALVAQVPPAQREALLEALRALSPEGRADLAVLAQRTPPQARDALRTELLAQPAPQRDAWLRARLRQ
ncbi:DUF3106 domain-containing protein [Luteimonas mephitis]|uniref:DUF3106 domain-containing protein n=1 Tax=Luteimonas mephitis TaxID=83615 RepID=UPI0006849E05|nr:DUF3106 domain-containing protein [Luteimonas mephitis]